MLTENENKSKRNQNTCYHRFRFQTICSYLDENVKETKKYLDILSLLPTGLGDDISSKSNPRQMNHNRFKKQLSF